MDPSGFPAALYPTFTPEKHQAAQVEVPGQAGGFSPMNEDRGVISLLQCQGREMNSDLGCRSFRISNKGV